MQCKLNKIIIKQLIIVIVNNNVIIRFLDHQIPLNVCGGNRLELLKHKYRSYL